MSMALALGPIARLRTRAVYADINCSRSWADKVILSSESQMELNFWLESLDFLNGKAIWFSSGATWIVYLMQARLVMVAMWWSWAMTLHMGSGQLTRVD